MEARCYSILFADRAITEDNGKKGLIGIFSGFNFPKFPAGVPLWFAYIALDNVPAGRHEFSVNLVRDEATQVVWASGGEVELKDDVIRQIEIVLPVLNCLFQKPGKHSLTVNLDGYQIGSRIIDVNLAAPPER